MHSLAASATPLILSIPSEAYPSSRHELWDDPRTDFRYWPKADGQNNGLNVRFVED